MRSRNHSRTSVCLLTALVTLLFSGCSLFGSDHDACSGTFSDEVRIIPCKGVDGVEFGDSRSEVEAKLGEPFSFGWNDGKYRSWRSSWYREGKHAGLYVDFIENEEGGAGPVDMFVITVPYDGKTEEGIGIGSSLSDVRRAYGMPAKISENRNDGDSAIHTYCFGDRHLNLGARGDTVFVINMGHYAPQPEGEARYCQ